MNPPGIPTGGSTPRRELQLQGTRPPQLRVSKESHKIKKPPLPQAHPLIIYSVSPKVIHVPVTDFMNVVQRLTGPSSPSRSGDVSPAARLASIEKTSPSEKARFHSGDDMMSILEGVEMSQFQGILSPAPSTLPPISSEIFSPVTDPETLALLHEFNPFWSANNLLGSPSGLFSASIVSPLPSPDLFNIFDFD